jgi:hypothetical protein
MGMHEVMSIPEALQIADRCRTYEAPTAGEQACVRLADAFGHGVQGVAEAVIRMYDDTDAGWRAMAQTFALLASVNPPRH